MGGWSFDISAKEGIALVLALGAMTALAMGLSGRGAKGIGWQFIRFNAIILALPLTAALALTDKLNAQSATILAGALGYAFGRSGTDEKPAAGDSKNGAGAERSNT